MSKPAPCTPSLIEIQVMSELDVYGAVAVVQAALPLLRAQGDGPKFDAHAAQFCSQRPERLALQQDFRAQNHQVHPAF